MKNTKIILLFVIITILCFVPIYDRDIYNYNDPQTSIQKLVDKYVYENPDKNVSILNYRQVTGGTRWEIVYSTEDKLVGSIVPIWFISPALLKNDTRYDSNIFLYRKILIITEKNKNIRKFHYDNEEISIVIPQKTIIAMPDDIDKNANNKYYIYNLSMLGIFLILAELSVVILFCYLLTKIEYKRIYKGHSDGSRPL